MPVVFHIPGPLREFTGGQSEIQFDGSPQTVAAALSLLWHRAPGIRYRVVTEQGKVREHINIFVNDECIRYTAGLETSLPDRCEIFIIPAVSGGAEFGVVLPEFAREEKANHTLDER